MEIFVNGEAMQVDLGLTLQGLVEQISDEPRGIAIERNLEIVPKSQHPNVVLKEGDRLEVVQFVGGG